MTVRVNEPEGWQWMTPEISRLLSAIPGPWEAKKRRTVILLAFAYATSAPLKTVFDRPDTCAEQIWWSKWKDIPEVAAAFDACRARALDWVDAETVSIEEQHRRTRRRAIAEYSAKAPAALAQVMDGADQKGADRIAAAETLMRWAEPETGSKLGRPSSPASIEQRVDVYDLGSLTDAELAALARIAQRPAGAAHGDGPAPVD
jgi:hypothetical protein